MITAAGSVMTAREEIPRLAPASDGRGGRAASNKVGGDTDQPTLRVGAIALDGDKT